MQLQRRLCRQLAALILQQAEVNLRHIGADQRALIVHQMRAVQLQFFACANHPKIAVIQQFFGIQRHILTGLDRPTLVIDHPGGGRQLLL
ncbi:hypothetical protein D3C80_468270 [compost metagenome]|nr:Uncharacterised protein [Serratia liquefaciens]